MEYIKILCKQMDAPKPRSKIDINFINEVKSHAFESLMYHINLDNNLYTSKLLSTKYEFQRKSSFKAYICRGNNGHIVKTVLKKRWWWSIVDKCDPEDCDFVWTQWLKPKVTKTIAQNSAFKSEIEQRRTFDGREANEHSFKQTCVYNRLSRNYHLANKKNLFLNLKKYYLATGKDPNSYIPVTYLIRKGPDDNTFKQFLEETERLSPSKVFSYALY